MRYAVVMPVRDEAAFLAGTARCLLDQDRRPAEWVIVDDGSADATGAIADALAAEHAWIHVVHRERAATRERGGPIVRAFEAGRAALRADVDVVVKLDGDLHLPAHYFAWVMDVFEQDPRAGVVGGTLFVLEEGRWVPDKVGRHTVHGAVKAYRTACLADIGGLRQTMGWDGIDEYGARAR
jgi:glycosyltransferase involved in cell wall biosynthesis